MSKSLGNVISPYDVVQEYGTDALRYYVARELSTFEDSDMTMEKFKESYNANLANGIGNLTSRIMKMAADNLEEPAVVNESEKFEEYFSYLENFEIGKAANYVWEKIGELDRFIQENQPFKVVKTDPEQGREMIRDLVGRLYSVAQMIGPLMPVTSEKIIKLIKENKTPEAPLFARKD